MQPRLGLAIAAIVVTTQLLGCPGQPNATGIMTVSTNTVEVADIADGAVVVSSEFWPASINTPRIRFALLRGEQVIDERIVSKSGNGGFTLRLGQPDKPAQPGDRVAMSPRIGFPGWDAYLAIPKKSGTW
ncbi:hypothetical protein D3C72_1433650 [compost metagenome]